MPVERSRSLLSKKFIYYVLLIKAMDKKALAILVLILASVVYLMFNMPPAENRGDEPKETPICLEGDDLCFWNHAMEGENPDYCTSIGNMSMRADCLTDLSYLGPGVCDDIENINLRDLCLNRSAGLSSLSSSGWICDGIWNASIKEKCIYSFAQQPDICLLIENRSQSKRCVLNLTYSLAFPSGCFMILNRSTQAECMINYSIRFHNFDGCLAASDNGLRYDCFYNISKRADALAFCDYPLAGRRDGCLLALSKVKPDLTVCRDVSDGALRESCFYDVALASHNYHACEEISDRGVHDNCLLEVTKLIGSYVACSSVVDELKRDQCFAYKG
jgi:hypothetical protein